MLLVLSLIASFAVPVQATGLSWEKVDRAVSADLADRLVQNETEEPTHRDTDIVRVSIVLEEKPTIQAGYSTMAIAQNHKAMAYQERLQAKQQVVAQNISSQVLGGKALDVVWNLTLVGNLISANVPYGKLEAIAQVDGVKDVCLEQQYAPAEAARSEDVAQPQMYTSAGMIGSDTAWLEGDPAIPEPEAGSQSLIPAQIRITSPSKQRHLSTLWRKMPARRACPTPTT